MGNLAGFLVCAAMLAFGYYLQFAVGLEPCPCAFFSGSCARPSGIRFFSRAQYRRAGSGGNLRRRD